VRRAQAQVLSLADPAALAGVHLERGCTREALASLLEGFRGALRQLPPDAAADGPDLVRGAGRRGGRSRPLRARDRSQHAWLAARDAGAGGSGNLAGALLVRMQGLCS